MCSAYLPEVKKYTVSIYVRIYAYYRLDVHRTKTAHFNAESLKSHVFETINIDFIVVPHIVTESFVINASN